MRDGAIFATFDLFVTIQMLVTARNVLT